MLQTEAIRFTYEALWLVLQLSGPPIVLVSVAGLLVALVQAATQLQEQTLQFVIKLVVLVIALFATATFLGGSLHAYADKVFSDFASIVRR
jgi:type III secretion protein S